METIYTIGHSNRTSAQFLELLQAHAIDVLVDIRTIPQSRHNPQFGQDALSTALQEVGIEYLYFGKLGGLRHATKESVNTGWENLSFRGYADYMATDEFWQSLRKLEEVAEKKRVALMCAEALWWRCHRSLVADALTVEGIQVLHIQSKKTAKPHELTSFLRVENGKLFYPAPENTTPS